MIELLIKLPDEWIDERGHEFVSEIFTHKRRLEEMFEKRLTDELMKQVKLPDIKISVEEVKDRMLEIKAREALDN